MHSSATMLAVLAACSLARVATAQYPDTCKVGNPVDCVLPPLSKWFRWKDTSGFLQEHVTQYALDALAGRRTALGRLGNDTVAWRKRVDEVRAAIPPILARGEGAPAPTSKLHQPPLCVLCTGHGLPFAATCSGCS